MKDDHEALSQMGLALVNHFACVYYVDIVILTIYGSYG